MYMASSSSSMPPRGKYDVFLSFSGDTRKKFTYHLFAALKQCGFIVFMDETELNRGEVISSELLRAIEESRISLIVFSKSYAKSRWCLDELVKITECRKTLQHIVLPIFYDVDPSDVRAQKGRLAEAFANHEERFKDDISKLEKWREALTEAANLSGWDLQNMANGYEAKFIETIVEEVGNKLNLALLNVAKYPVGLESRPQKLNELLSMESNDVRIVGIWGIGGLGKTTIVKMLYNRIRYKFDGISFLANVRETSKQSNGLVVLQERLCLDICKNGTPRITNSDQGIEILKQRAFRRKVLLVLDDVDHVQQLRALAVDQRNSFGSGSRIIVTTRDKSLLDSLEVDEIYAPMELDKNESLELFSLHAFREVRPEDDFVEFSNEVVQYAGGLPLALEVLGSFLRRKNIPEWKSAIGKLRKIPHNDIQGQLKLSFDSLSTEKKELFLDIACFFVGMDQRFKIKILESCNFLPAIGIRILVDRCLIKYECFCNHIVMHDLLRDMGREIVRLESLKEPGRRSRLWYYEDALEVLRDGTGTEAVEGFFLHLPEPKVVQVKANAFKKMNLRLLGLDYVLLSKGYEHISKRLVWLSWKGFALKPVASNLPMENLVFLDLSYSSFKQVWKGKMNLVKLKFLYLSHCYYLKSTPNLSGFNNLEELLLNDCIRLAEIDESIGCLDKLLVLDLKNCKKLRKLPSSIWMLKSLECLDLSGSSKLENLSRFRGSLSKSSYLSSLSSWTLRTKSVGSIQGLRFLKKLNMEECNLSHLPSEIGNLVSLTELNLRRNCNLCAVPDSIGNLTCLEYLRLAYCNLSYLPSEIGNLVSLTELDLEDNRNLCAVPDSIGNLTCLEDLQLGYCNLSYLPSEIGNLVSLMKLYLRYNKNLCALPDSIGNLTRLETLRLAYCNLSHLPSEIGRLSSLKNLSLRNNNNLCTVPDSIFDLSCLEYLWLDRCNLSHLPSEIGKMTSLRMLTLKGNNFRSLPEGIGNLTHLGYLNLGECANLHSLPQLPLSCEVVSANDCTSLQNESMESLYGLLHPHLLFSDRKQLIVNNFATNFRKDILQIKQGQSIREKRIKIHLSGDEVPRWLMYQSTGSCLFFKVPPLDNRKILGFILGAVYNILIFNNKTKGVVSDPVKCRVSGEFIYADGGLIESQLLLIYVPLYYLRMHFESGDEVEISIRFDKTEHSVLSDEGALVMKKWGMNILYEVEE